MRQPRDDGFSLAEILVVVAIVGVLAAIALPLAINQQARAADGSTRAALTAAVATVEARLLDWRGAPPEALNICHTAVTYPSAAAPTNTCAPARWAATQTSDNAAVAPPLGGTVPDGVILQGRVAADGSYCLDGSHERPSTDRFRYVSSTREVEVGTCFQAGWTSAGSKIGTAGATAPGNVPSEPTGVFTDVNASNNTVVVKWDALSGVTYTVKVAGQPAKKVTATATGQASCVFPAATCAGPASGALDAGSYTASVRAGTTDGVSAESTNAFSVAADGGVLSVKVDMNAAANPAPVATVEGMRENLLPNPSFETGTNGYGTAQSSLVASGDVAYVGSNSTKTTMSSTTDSNVVYPGVGTVPEAGTYTASAYFYIPPGSPLAGRTVSITGEGGSGFSNGTSSPATLVAGEWVRASRQIVTTGTRRPSLVARLSGSLGSARTNVVYSDGWMLEKTPTTKAYFDGDSVNAFWTGTKNASTSIANLPTAARGRVKVAWNEPAIAVGKQVTYSVVSDPGSNTCTIVSATSCYVEGLDDDTDYTFTVTAVTDAGAGRAGTSATVRTPPAPALPASPPTQVIGIQGVPVAPAGSIKLTWTGVASTGGSAVTDYVIERATGGSGWQELNDPVSVATEFTDTGLVPNQTYQYRLYAKNEAGTGPASDTVAVGASHNPSPPEMRAALTYKVSSHSASLAVNTQPTTDSGEVTLISGYSTSPTITKPADLPSGTSGSLACDAATCTVTWPNLQSKLGTKQYFYVFAQNDVGYAAPYIASQGAPDPSIVSHSQYSQTRYCPSTHTMDLGNGNCRAFRNYTYYKTGYYQQTRWWEGGCGGCNRAPCWCNPPPPGGGSARGPDCEGACTGYPWRGTCGISRGYEVCWMQKSPNPAGWFDNGSQWYQDVPKVVVTHWKISPNGGWSDANLNAKRTGVVLVRGSEAASGQSGDLGRCPGPVSYEILGIGGRTTGSYTPPCG